VQINIVSGALVGAGGAYMDERSGQEFAYTAAMIPPSSNAPKVRGTSTWADMMETEEDAKNVAKGRKQKREVVEREQPATELIDHFLNIRGKQPATAAELRLENKRLNIGGLSVDLPARQRPPLLLMA
jgi:hypothetical protein